MRNLLRFVGKHIDPILALVVAVAVAGLDLFSTMESDTIGSGILLVLGVLSVAILRDRVRAAAVEDEVRAELNRTATIQTGQQRLQGSMAELHRTLEESGMVRTLRGAEITEALAEARRDTDRWLFRGGTGTYIRAVTLPECVRTARARRRVLAIRLEILDPTNTAVCERYVRFRHSLAGDHGDWSTERTQREAYATIVACCWHRQRYDLLDIEVGLTSVMPTLRWDLSATGLVVTQENRNQPGLLVKGGSLFHTYLETELRKSLEQARPVPLDAARHSVLGEAPTVDEVRKLFRDLDLALPSTYTDRDVQDIVRRALTPTNPYQQP